MHTDGTVAPCFPMYASTYDWGNIDGHKFDSVQLLAGLFHAFQHGFSTLNQSSLIHFLLTETSNPRLVYIPRLAIFDSRVRWSVFRALPPSNRGTEKSDVPDMPIAGDDNPSPSENPSVDRKRSRVGR